jgi:hypothetical protein
VSDQHTRALRPDATLVARMAAAYRDGRDTARGRQPRRLPWRADAPDAPTRVLARMWARGYSAGNPVRLPE